MLKLPVLDVDGEKLGVVRDYYCPVIPGHDCRVFRCKLVKC